MISELGISQKVVDIHYDSSSAIYLSKSPSIVIIQHIDIKLHFIRNVVLRGVGKMVKVRISNNPVDMLTEVVPAAKFKTCLDIAGLCGF